MGKEEKEKKRRKPKKGNRMLRKLLCILQHVALGVMILSVFVVVCGSTVEVKGFRNSIIAFNRGYWYQGSVYEDSDIFNGIFGYAVADIIRYGVVSGQLETDGSFDSSKPIDVTAYNYRDIGMPDRYVTADYRLGDLLKWENYGFEWTNTEMTRSQAADFLSDKTRVTVIDPQSEYYNTSDANYLKSDVESYTFVNDVSSNQIWTDTDIDGFVDGYRANGAALLPSGSGEAETEILEVDPEAGYTDSDDAINTYAIMVNRYKTVEGKNLEEYVSDWDIYYDLCHNVQNAAKSLAYNYQEYLDYGEYFNPKNSNVTYLIMKTVGDETQIYSNLNTKNDIEKVTEFMADSDGTDHELVNKAGKYIYYSPSDMTYQTNTTIAEGTVREILNSYDYAYPESVKIWINVDTTYPVSDVFMQGAIGFQNYTPYFWQWIAAALSALILYLVLLFYLTMAAGRDIDEEGKQYIRLETFDSVPTEVMLLIAVGAWVLAVWIFIVIVELANVDIVDIVSTSDGVIYEEWFKVLLVAGVFVADAVLMFFYYSFVRRIKAKTLWKNSYLRKFAHKIKKFIWKVYDNGNIVLRTWVPYGAFLMFNFIMLLCAFVTDGFRRAIALLIAVALDFLVGNLLYRNTKEKQDIVNGIETIASGALEYQVNTDNIHGDNLTLAHSVNSIGKGIKDAVEISMKDERMKADLITNVSHDIKTPLTSIINYVDLIKREQVNNEKVQNYIRVLDEKSQRLKQLTDDLVEASKISSGNINLHFEKINLTELMNQTVGEFSEKFEQKNLTTVMNVNAPNTIIEADSRRIWRVIENLFNNIFKYAMEGTRVYLTIDNLPDNVGYIALSVKNISASPLNCNPDELTERFIRGDESRTTEGSGLGLSIAKNLTEAQKGTFEIQLDGDLFKVIMTFPLARS
ncbi:MAG: HAMP domain-containing histidine kinase [Lachnospiraceae bacterium]|nr:HAMP domain-containing histidine kinase [Lachnospiraceae bacterium]